MNERSRRAVDRMRYSYNHARANFSLSSSPEGFHSYEPHEYKEFREDLDIPFDKERARRIFMIVTAE